MAEISNTTENQKKAGVRKSKKLSTRVDLTPMVDLGFLLITFFIFTTTMSQPNVLKLAMPKDTNQDPTLIPLSGAMTIQFQDLNKIAYYFGTDSSSKKVTDYKSLREAIINKKKTTSDDKLFVIIKPQLGSSFSNVIKVLDEMTINDVRRYAIVD